MIEPRISPTGAAGQAPPAGGPRQLASLRSSHAREVRVRSSAERLSISVGPERSVSGLLLNPTRAWACCVLAHGAGAGMSHPFLEGVAADLYERGMATLRYQFPYMEAGARRPDPPKL